MSHFNVVVTDELFLEDGPFRRTSVEAWVDRRVFNVMAAFCSARQLDFGHYHFSLRDGMGWTYQPTPLVVTEALCGAFFHTEVKTHRLRVFVDTE